MTDAEPGAAAAEDAALMARVVAGDRVAFARLLERHLPRTVALARRFLGSREEAEDVAQEAFLRVWTQAARWKPEIARFSTWLWRITANLCLDRMRRPRASALEEAPEPADEREGADAAIARRQLEAAVRAAIADLPERQRLAIILCVFEGVGDREAAQILGLTVHAVESLLVRARRRLRDRLGPYAHLVQP